MNDVDARTAGPSPAVEARQRLGGAAASVRDARRFVRRALAGWHLDALAPVAEVLVSELATNAIEHAGSELEVRLEWAHPVVRIEVADRAPERSLQARAPDVDDERGRGLAIVERLSERWGVEVDGETKWVWCELEADR